MTIEQLNADFGLADHLKIVTGKGDLPLVEVASEKARAVISVYGGQVLSYKPANQDNDLMFLSELAYFEEGKAIKGGAPVCWPWFGPDPEDKGRPGHGFMRNRMWQIKQTELQADGNVRVVLGLSDSDETRAIWPQSFELAIEINVGESLNIDLVTRNRGDQPFTISQALHTYFRIGDINQTKILGLEGCGYIDKVDGGSEKQQDGEVVITSEVDRIYLDVPPELVIEDAALQRSIRIASEGSKSAVVWNPWDEIAAGMGDLQDDDYLRFVCVETTNAATDTVEVGPGDEYRLLANYGVE